LPTSNVKKEKKSQKAKKAKNEELLRQQIKENSISLIENKSSHLTLLGKRFRIEDDLLGFGSFGRTYLGKDIKRNK
jgi:hypothetical protein